MISFQARSIQACHELFSHTPSTFKSPSAYLEQFSTRGQTFHTCIEDEDLLSTIISAGEKYKGKYSHIVVFGIGGSALGTTMLKETLLPKNKAQQLIVVDHLDSTVFTEVLEDITISSTLFIVISKSGTTLETMSQYFYCKQLLETNHLSLAEHLFIITDENKGFLRQEVERYGLDSLIVPDGLGGRFSVLSPVGLFPAYLLGINIHALIEGARSMKMLFLSENSEKNLPYQLAQLQYLAHEHQRPIHVFFPYATKLTSFGAWWTQLIAESIGKTPRVGITPLTSVGVTDQHSALQLYSDGPLDKFFLFVHVEEPAHSITVPAIQEDAYAYLSGRTFHELTTAELHGTEHALEEKGQACLRITLSLLDEHHIGQLIFLMEATTAFLGELFEIDAFTQPGVERSKQVTQHLLHT